MTDYAGEAYTVWSTLEWEGTALGDTDVDEVVVEIHDAADDVVVAETAMTYDATNARWEYDWNTAAVDAGTYFAKVTGRGVGAGEVFEFKRIRLRAPRF